MKYVLLLILAGCGGGQTLSPTFPDNRAEDLRAVSERLASSSASDRPIAVGVAEIIKNGGANGR